MDYWTPKVGETVRVLEYQSSKSIRENNRLVRFEAVPPISTLHKVKKHTKSGYIYLDNGDRYHLAFGWRKVQPKGYRGLDVALVPADTSKMREIIMSAMRFRGRRFSSVGDITQFNGYDYYEVTDLLLQLRSEGLAECSFAREAECDWRLTDKGMTPPIHNGGTEESPEVAAERDRLHNACGAAYDLTGAINTPEWWEAARALDAFRSIHGYEYNPD